MAEWTPTMKYEIPADMPEIPMSKAHQDYVREIIDSRYREMEKSVKCFYECGVTLDRMHIVDSRDFKSTTLFVDGVARFVWKLGEPTYG